MKKLFMILLIVLLAACTRVETPVDPSTKEPIEQPEKDSIALSDFFMKDGTTAKYAGEGNEFAQLTIKTQWLNDRYVNTYTSSGTSVLTTYRIDEDKIVVLQSIPETYDIVTPTEAELSSMEPISTYLQLPFEIGATFDGWTIIDTTATLDTPLQTFTNVIVIEEQNEEGSINRNYFAKGYGFIKSEFIMKDGDQLYTVSSTIAEIEESK